MNDLFLFFGMCALALYAVQVWIYVLPLSTKWVGNIYGILGTYIFLGIGIINSLIRVWEAFIVS